MKAIFKFLSVAFVTLFIFSCSKDDDNNGGNNNGNTIEGITVTTIDITNVKTILATANSKVEVDATKATLTAKGIVWSTSANPTISLTTKTVENNTVGNFQSPITDLQHSTKYYVKAYATDNKGNTVYGNEISFTTKAGWQTIVSSGNFSVLGIKTDGTLWGWGSNNFGQLGDGSTNQRNSPVQIGADNNWKQISTGGTYDITPSVHSGYTLAIKNDGSLWAWGNNSDGQLGIGNTSNSYLPTRIGNSNDWKQVKASGYTSSAIKNDGSVWHWGRLKIAFGSSSPLQSNVPVQYAGMNQVDFLSVEHSGSAYNYLVKKNDGSTWGWGTNSNGQVGNGTISSQINNPTQISNTLNFTSIINSQSTSFGMTNSGTLYAWGQNNNGQLGDGTNADKNVPTLINTINSCKSISCSGGNTFVVKLDGTLWATGDGNEGCFGNGGTNNVFYTFTKIGNATDWKSVFVGNRYTFAIKNNGSLWAAGTNNLGQLGLGTPNYINSTFLLVE